MTKTHTLSRWAVGLLVVIGLLAAGVAQAAAQEAQLPGLSCEPGPAVDQRDVPACTANDTEKGVPATLVLPDDLDATPVDHVPGECDGTPSGCAACAVNASLHLLGCLHLTWNCTGGNTPICEGTCEYECLQWP